MPSTCPKCHGVVAEDVVCCADLVYTWKCVRCHKVSSGFAIPYGKCFMCGGALEVVKGHEFDDPLKVRPIRDAVQFELNSYHFYRLALRKTGDPTLRVVLNELYQHEVDHLHTLQERYHTHLSDDLLNLSPRAEWLLEEELFKGIALDDPRGGPAGLYDKAIEMERRTRDHFNRLAAELPDGAEKEVCQELAAEEEEHVALLETEREQFRAG
jgi:glutamate synthase (NADPH/NADH) small chain